MSGKIIYYVSKDIEDKIVSLYLDKHGASYISKTLNIKISTVYRVLKENKIKTRSNSEKGRIHSVDENYFEKIDSEEKAYWLGFLAADGYVSANKEKPVIGLALSEKDRSHLEKFKKSIKSSSPILTFHGNGYGANHDYVRITICRSKTRSDLISHGVIPKKTNNIKPPNIDSEWYIPFIRGYFDGNGSVCINKNKDRYTVSFISTEEMLLWIGEIICKKFNWNMPKFQKRKSGQIVSELRFGGRNKTLQIMELLYKNATIYLERKYNKWFDI